MPDGESLPERPTADAPTAAPPPSPPPTALDIAKAQRNVYVGQSANQSAQLCDMEIELRMAQQRIAAQDRQIAALTKANAALAARLKAAAPIKIIEPIAP